jgi:glutathione S-transferase
MAIILIGQYDSPFVRRVGIALQLLDIPFEHRPWSSFGDRERVATYNPLHRVPTLVLDDGDAILDSHMMLDFIDSLAGPEAAMFPQSEPARRRALRVASLATGVADKAVSLFYELRLHAEPAASWMERCRSQIFNGLGVLEAERAAGSTEYWFGDRIGHADIAVVATLRFIQEAHPGLITREQYPTLGQFSEKLEAVPAFRTIYQRFIPPA